MSQRIPPPNGHAHVTMTRTESQWRHIVNDQTKQIDRMKQIIRLMSERGKKEDYRKQMQTLEKEIQHRVKHEIARRKAAHLPVPADGAWCCSPDEFVYPWIHKGKPYLRNSANQVWALLMGAPGDDYQAGDWCGVYREASDDFDESAEEPDFDES